MGGLRIFSDESRRVGELLKMEFFLADVPPVTYTAEVVWVERLGAGAPARFDLGLKFIQLEPEALKLLLQVLGPPEGPPDDGGAPEGDGPLEGGGGGGSGSGENVT